jgi:transposase
MCLNDHHINELDPVCDGGDECCPVDSDSVLEFHEAESNSDFALQTARGSENGDDCMNCPLRRENSILKSERAYWRKMHQKAVERENRLKGEKAELEAKLKLREKQLYGRKSEKSSGKSETERPDGEKRPRGQQRESRGHGRRDYSHLEAETEVLCLPENERTCSICGLPFEEFPDTEDSEILEIEVRAHRRIIKRKKYIPACRCRPLPEIVCAPPAARVLPKGIYGVSVWVEALLDKYLFMRPTNRLLEDLRTRDFDLAQGTLTDGLKAMAPLFDPVIQAIVAKNLEEKQWHADETRWYVFATIEGKIGYRWYLWVFISESAVVYVLDPSRSAQVPKEHFGEDSEGFLNVDRYGAYKSLAKDCDIVLAYCWAHVRRDFLAVSNNWPQHSDWAMEWVALIGNLYHLNNSRLEVLEHPEKFAERDRELRRAVDEMAEKKETERKDEKTHYACKKVLDSLDNHWEGLTVFVDHPEIPMDNNKAERQVRGPVVGRKNYYGSGSEWSGRLAAVLFSIFQTLGLFNLNPRRWLEMYLQACAENGGEPPRDIGGFLPWNMTRQRLAELSFEPAPRDSS